MRGVRSGKLRLLFAAVVVASASLLSPQTTRAGLIVSWSTEPPESVTQQLSSHEGFDNGLCDGSYHNAPVRSPLEKTPADEQPRPQKIGIIDIAADLAGGGTSVPISGSGSTSRPLGIFAGCDVTVHLTFLGYVSSEMSLASVETVLGGLLDPPRVSA